MGFGGANTAVGLDFCSLKPDKSVGILQFQITLTTLAGSRELQSAVGRVGGDSSFRVQEGCGGGRMFSRVVEREQDTGCR